MKKFLKALVIFVIIIAILKIGFFVFNRNSIDLPESIVLKTQKITIVSHGYAEGFSLEIDDPQIAQKIVRNISCMKGYKSNEIIKGSDTPDITISIALEGEETKLELRGYGNAIHDENGQYVSYPFLMPRIIMATFPHAKLELNGGSLFWLLP